MYAVTYGYQNAMTSKFHSVSVEVRDMRIRSCKWENEMLLAYLLSIVPETCPHILGLENLVLCKRDFRPLNSRHNIVDIVRRFI